MIKKYFSTKIRNINESDIQKYFNNNTNHFWLGTKFITLEFDENQKLIESIQYYHYQIFNDYLTKDSFYSYNLYSSNITGDPIIIIYMKFINNLYFVYSTNLRERFLIVSYQNNLEKVYIDIAWSLAKKVKNLKQYFNILKKQGDQNIDMIEQDYFTYIKKFKHIINSYKFLFELQC